MKFLKLIKKSKQVKEDVSVEEDIFYNPSKADVLANKPFFLNSTAYCFPLKYKMFRDLNAEFDNEGNFGIEKIVPPYFACSKKTVINQNKDVNPELLCFFMNTSEVEQKVSDSDIIGFSIDLVSNTSNDEINLVLPGKLTWGSTKEKFISVYGQPSHISETDDGREEIYWRVKADAILRAKFLNNKLNAVMLHSYIRGFLKHEEEFSVTDGVPVDYRVLSLEK